MKKINLFEKEGVEKIIFSEKFPIRVLTSILEKGETNDEIHEHPEDSEYYFVLEGKIQLEVCGKIIDLSANQLCVVEKAEKHRIIRAMVYSKVIIVRSRIGSIERIPKKA